MFSMFLFCNNALGDKGTQKIKICKIIVQNPPKYNQLFKNNA